MSSSHCNPGHINWLPAYRHNMSGKIHIYIYNSTHPLSTTLVAYLLPAKTSTHHDIWSNQSDYKSDDLFPPPFWTTKSIRRSAEQTEVPLVEKLEKTSSQKTLLNQTKSRVQSWKQMTRNTLLLLPKLTDSGKVGPGRFLVRFWGHEFKAQSQFSVF